MNNKRTYAVICGSHRAATAAMNKFLEFLREHHAYTAILVQRNPMRIDIGKEEYYFYSKRENPNVLRGRRFTKVYEEDRF